jgi:hypothetical protein
MARSPFYRYPRKALTALITQLARRLPLWNTAETVTLLPPMLSLPVTRPANLHLLPQPFADQFIAVKSIPARRLFRLQNVHISKDAVVYRNLRIFTPSLTWLRDLELYRNGSFLVQQWRRPGNKLPAKKTVAMVFDQWSASNYYHWMIESLPRLLLAQTAYPDCLFLIPDPAPGYITETLALWKGIQTVPLAKQGAFVPKESTLVVPELVYYEYTEADVLKPENNAAAVPATPEIAALQQTELIVAVRKRLLASLTFAHAVPHRKIFVSRAQQKTRRLANEAAIWPLFEKHGFEKVYFETLSFGEQVRLMQETKVFAGVHGANMVNLLFLQPGAQVVELMNEAHVNDAYYLLASSIKLPYYVVPCRMADGRLTPQADRVELNDADLWVEADDVEQTLALLPA